MAATPIRLQSESEKVRYFRDALASPAPRRQALLGDDMRFRIVVGGSGKMAAFLQAVDAIKAEGLPANQFIYGSKDKSLMFPLTNIRPSEEALWFFPRATLGASVDEILEEEGAEACEVVIFE